MLLPSGLAEDLASGRMRCRGLFTLRNVSKDEKALFLLEALDSGYSEWDSVETNTEGLYPTCGILEALDQANIKLG